MKILSKIFKDGAALSSADLRAASAEIEAQLAAVETRLKDREAARRELMIGDGTREQVKALDNEISDLRFEIDKAALQIEALQPRIKAAEQAENARAVEACAVQLRGTSREMRDLSLKIHDNMLALDEMLTKGKSLAADLHKGNSFLRENGRGDLKVDHPVGRAAQNLGREMGNFMSYLYFEYPINPHPDSARLIKALQDLEL